MGDRQGEAATITGLGCCYSAMGQYQRAIDFIEQSLPIHQEFKDRPCEEFSLLCLGLAHTALGFPQKALEYYQQSLRISQSIGDRKDEANCLYSMADAIAKLDRPFEALITYQKAQAIFEEIPLEHMVKQCKDTISNLNKIIPVQSTPFPDIPKRKPKTKMSREERIYFGFVGGILLVSFLWWLKR